MDNERRRPLDEAYELIEEVERPGAYIMLGLTREAPSSEIQRAMIQALTQQTQRGYPMKFIANAQKQLKDAQKRLELDAQVLSLDEWMPELDVIRNRYALFDFLKDAGSR